MKDTTETMALLDRARQGDELALEELLRAVQPELYRFSMKMCRHSADAEDVLQDSMMTLARTFRDFRGDSSLSTWLYKVTRSFCIKKRRKSKFAPKAEESLEHLAATDHEFVRTNAPNPEQHTQTLETWRQVQEALQRLEPDQREVLVLRDIEGLSAKEVSEVVSISVAAVKSRLHRARSSLRDLLTDESYTPKPGCPNIRHVFSQHLEDELSPQICMTLEEHVAGCTSCAAECDGLKAALNACSSAPCEVPEDVQARVQEALKLAIARHSS